MACRVAGGLAALMLLASAANGQVLVGNPFITSYQNWVDPYPSVGGNWRLSLHNPTIMETANTTPAAPGAPDITTPHSGNYYPMLLVQNGYTTPATYDLNARMYTSDDDLWGLVFGYQDENNYYRVGFRSQASGNLGGTSGVSVQKVSGGVISQITPPGAGTAYLPFPTFGTSDTRAPVDVRVAVNGTNYSVFVAGENGDQAVVTGSDPGLTPGKIGIQSWAQRNRAAIDPHWGTEVESINVKQGATTLYSGTFTTAIPWRQVTMTNANGVNVTSTGAGEDRGNFGLDINAPYIYQQTNGFENATFGNVDFIGPGVVVDSPGSNAFTNYQMQLRMGATDNDGYGLLFRVQDDNNFYRLNFASEAVDAAGVTRAPRGLSVQKVRNGVWTEIYRDDQANPMFVPPVGAAGQTPVSGLPMFDVSVGAVGSSFKIQVRDQNGDVINYPLITDNSDPILSGTVGLTTWGTENTYYSTYGGGQTSPLLTTLTAFTTVDVTVNRSTGGVTVTNNGASPLNIKGINIGSEAGSLNGATWMSVTNFYDEAPQNGSVDPDDPWTITSSTSLSLSEREQSGGNGGTLAVGQTVNLGNIWRKSRIEDLTLDLELNGGGLSTASVSYSGGPGGESFDRADLNADGSVNAADWPLFYPNLLADLSSMTAYERAIGGDLDGDGDTDITDFSLFKADFDAVNGVGAFQAMVAGVPEPASASLVLLGGLALVACRRRSSRVLLPALLAATTLGVAAQPAAAAAVDLTTFSTENFVPAATFPIAVWDVTPTTATHNSNSDASVLYSPDSALNKRYIGRVIPGTDDDVIGFVLGFEPGDSAVGSSADYLLLDWKGITQTFEFADADPFNFHHDQTTSGSMPVGLALSRVTGSPTADEMWQHLDLAGNPTGGVTELARGATLGSTPYNRSGGSHLVDISYTASRVIIKVDGVQEFDVAGSFPDGRFGLYTAHQGPPASFSDFQTVPTGFAELSATVDRATGAITLQNPGTAALEFDYYQFTSASGSLNTSGWNSLSDQNFQSVGAGNGQSWDEAGGSSSTALGEAFLQSQSSLAASGTVSLGNAYNNVLNGEDLVLTFRLPGGLVMNGPVTYTGVAPTLQGDFDSNGLVDGADFLLWQRQFGGPGSADANNSGTVDGADLTIWKNNYGQPGATASTAAVPEPSAIAIALVLAVGALSQRRRR